MIQLADEVFYLKNRPQPVGYKSALDHLRRIHPATVSQHDDGKGPVAWILLIPITIDLMNRFLNHEISEKELYEFTPLDTTYETLYLCSAMVLKQSRRKGIAKQLTLDAIAKIRKDHPLKALFVWTFSKERLFGAEALARLISLPLHKRIERRSTLSTHHDTLMRMRESL